MCRESSRVSQTAVSENVWFCSYLDSIINLMTLLSPVNAAKVVLKNLKLMVSNEKIQYIFVDILKLRFPTIEIDFLEKKFDENTNIINGL